jgi:hypothetical protein
MALPYKTTAKDFALFKKTFQHYVQMFGMQEWTISYIWEHDESQGAAAAIVYNSPGKGATVYLHKTWSLPVTDKKIKRYAVHEFAHLLTADLSHLAQARYIREDEIFERNDAIARRFENFFYPDSK